MQRRHTSDPRTNHRREPVLFDLDSDATTQDGCLRWLFGLMKYQAGADRKRHFFLMLLIVVALCVSAKRDQGVDASHYLLMRHLEQR